MKATIITAMILLVAGLGTSCKDTASQFEPVGEMENHLVQSDTIKPRTGGLDQNTSEDSNYDEASASGKASEPRPVQTQVNKAKQIQQKNRANAVGYDGYSAPDGTPAENYDGDMYTKFDTTRMPSGATPIK